MEQITIEAPCKINLSLDIVGKLPNGYHEMDMVMQTVSLYDTLTLSLHPGKPQITMSCTVESGAALACDETNIAVRCARAFFEKTGIPLSGSLHIDLVKRIPMMAGLGGGSADGAGVLAGLDLLTDAGCSLEQLESERTFPSACAAALSVRRASERIFLRCRRCRTVLLSSSSRALASAQRPPLPAVTLLPMHMPMCRR